MRQTEETNLQTTLSILPSSRQDLLATCYIQRRQTNQIINYTTQIKNIDTENNVDILSVLLYQTSSLCLPTRHTDILISYLGFLPF